MAKKKVFLVVAGIVGEGSRTIGIFFTDEAAKIAAESVKEADWAYVSENKLGELSSGRMIASYHRDDIGGYKYNAPMLKVEEYRAKRAAYEVQKNTSYKEEWEEENGPKTMPSPRHLVFARRETTFFLS